MGETQETDDAHNSRSLDSFKRKIETTTIVYGTLLLIEEKLKEVKTVEEGLEAVERMIENLRSNNGKDFTIWLKRYLGLNYPQKVVDTPG